jgi:hypothetical protein
MFMSFGRVTLSGQSRKTPQDSTVHPAVDFSGRPDPELGKGLALEGPDHSATRHVTLNACQGRRGNPFLPDQEATH